MHFTICPECLRRNTINGVWQTNILTRRWAGLAAIYLISTIPLLISSVYRHQDIPSRNVITATSVLVIATIRGYSLKKP